MVLPTVMIMALTAQAGVASMAEEAELMSETGQAEEDLVLYHKEVVQSLLQAISPVILLMLIIMVQPAMVGKKALQEVPG